MNRVTSVGLGYAAPLAAARRLFDARRSPLAAANDAQENGTVLPNEFRILP